MVHGEALDPFAELKRSHEEYRVYDAHYESLGKAGELFVDADDRPLYIGIKTGFLEARSVLVPLEVIRVNDKRRVMEVSGDADQIRHAPTLEDREEITADLEARVHAYFGLPNPLTGEHHGSLPDPAAEDRFAPDERIDIEPGERQGAHERFGETPPAHTDRDDRPPNYLSGGSQESPSRSTGKGWARGTEGLQSRSESPDAARDARAARSRRLRR